MQVVRCIRKLCRCEPTNKPGRSILPWELLQVSCLSSSFDFPLVKGIWLGSWHNSFSLSCFWPECFITATGKKLKWTKRDEGLCQKLFHALNKQTDKELNSSLVSYSFVWVWGFVFFLFSHFGMSVVLIHPPFGQWCWWDIRDGALGINKRQSHRKLPGPLALYNLSVPSASMFPKF